MLNEFTSTTANIGEFELYFLISFEFHKTSTMEKGFSSIF